MDALNRWLEEQSSTPAGGILLALAMLIVRLSIDEWSRRRAQKRAAKRKKTASG